MAVSICHHSKFQKNCSRCAASLLHQRQKFSFGRKIMEENENKALALR